MDLQTLYSKTEFGLIPLLQGDFRAVWCFLIYCVKTEYFMMSNILNYVWGNIVNL